jgi:hypothetical protein
MCLMPHSSDERSASIATGHHSSDGIAVAGYLPIATEGYGPLLQRCTVVVDVSIQPHPYPMDA